MECLRELNMYSLTLRLALAVICGGAIGMEREYKGRPAGFRTYMFAALGAAVTMLLSQYLYIMLTENQLYEGGTAVLTDVSRLGAQVINGVGFLGAGTILVTSKQEVRGLTTAAGLWASACLGIAIGAGFYECAVLGAALILVSMGIFSGAEERIMRRVRNMNVYIELESPDAARHTLAGVRERGIEIYDMDMQNDEAGTQCMIMSLRLVKSQRHYEALSEFSSYPGVRSVREI